jgi:hypothetical protein
MRVSAGHCALYSENSVLNFIGQIFKFLTDVMLSYYQYI